MDLHKNNPLRTNMIAVVIDGIVGTIYRFFSAATERYCLKIDNCSTEVVVVTIFNVVKRSLMVQWVVGSRPSCGGPTDLFLVPVNTPRLV